MNSKIFVIGIAFTLFVLSSCNTSNSVEEIIVDKMDLQVECWNSGDIECFMLAYWNSDSLIFMNSNGIKRGYYNVLERYKRDYPDLETMGKLQFEILQILPRSEEVYQVIGKYYLTRETGNAEGNYSLIWKKFNDDWFIVSDSTF